MRRPFGSAFALHRCCCWERSRRISATGEGGVMSSESASQGEAAVLSSAKREDIWALIIAGFVMLISIAAPEAVYSFFKKVLYIF
jgi:hypothetical protein